MLTCSICCETNGVEMINVNIGKGRTQEIPYCKRHAEYLKPTCQTEHKTEDDVVAYCCGRPVNKKYGRCSTCGDRYD
jgi:hypothetical protein